jgi:hypothetical protein
MGATTLSMTTQHNALVYDTQHNNGLHCAECRILFTVMLCHFAECRYAECRGAILMRPGKVNYSSSEFSLLKLSKSSLNF